MIRQLTSLILCNALVLFMCTSAVGASSQAEKEAKETAEVKALIAKFGTETERRIEMKLRNKTKLTGYLRQIDEEYFVISNSKTGAAMTIAYAQVRQVKQVKDHHLSERKMFVIAAVIVTALFTWANSTNKP